MSCPNVSQDRLGQAQKTDRVADVAARFTDRVAQRLVRQAEIQQQALVSLRLFNGIQVLSLQILDKSNHRRVAVVHISLHSGNFCQTRLRCSAKASFTRNELIALSRRRVRSDKDRLQNPLDPD